MAIQNAKSSKLLTVLAPLILAMAMVGAQSARAEDAGQNAANNPLEAKWTYQQENYFTPDSYNGKHASIVNDNRFLVPWSIGERGMLVRATIPVVDQNYAWDKGGRISGLGDIQVQTFALFHPTVFGKEITWGMGPMFTAPSGKPGSIGTGRWQLGPSTVIISKWDFGLVGAMISYQHSIDRSEHFSTTSNIAVQPIIYFNLPDQWYFRSQAVWNFNFKSGTHFIPLGLGFGRVFKGLGSGVFNMYVEAQPTMMHRGPAPKFQLLAGLKYQWDPGIDTAFFKQ